MYYNEFKDKKLSALGMGGMRLPKCGDKDTDVDVAETRAMFQYALEHGVNYFDTAYRYHGGRSEEVFGEILSEFPRESYYLATKFPGFEEDLFLRKEEVFEDQLRKCRTDHFDFYLLHCVYDKNIDMYTNPAYGLREFLIEQKACGRIQHIGFSAHCDMQAFERMFDFYGDLIEFCQLQLNWQDWSSPNVSQQYARLRERGIPVWVMEPVRGGGLVNLKPIFEEQVRAFAPTESNVELAFRFIQSLPPVTMTLSGMSNMAQVQQNVAIFSERRPLTAEMVDELTAVGKEMSNPEAVPCTTCRYCVDACPQGLDIPLFTEAYNTHVFSHGTAPLSAAVTSLPSEKLPSACIGCGACEALCPQKINISGMMRTFTEKVL